MDGDVETTETRRRGIPTSQPVFNGDRRRQVCLHGKPNRHAGFRPYGDRRQGVCFPFLNISRERERERVSSYREKRGKAFIHAGFPWRQVVSPRVSIGDGLNSED